MILKAIERPEDARRLDAKTLAYKDGSMPSDARLAAVKIDDGHWQRTDTGYPMADRDMVGWTALDDIDAHYSF